MTHLEMLQHPALPPDSPGAWTLRLVDNPAPDWFREVYRRIGAEWLWFSRLRMSDAELTALIQSPTAEIYALVHDGRDEGLLHLDFSEPSQCELSLFGVTAQLVGSGAGRFLMNRARERAWLPAITRWVHTCSFDHPNALAFCQRASFRAFRRQVAIADDPRLDGTLPRDVAGHVPVIG